MRSSRAKKSNKTHEIQNMPDQIRKKPVTLEISEYQI